MTNRTIINMAILGASMGALSVPQRVRRGWFGIPKDKRLVLLKINPSESGCRRYDQIQRDRKRRMKLNRKMYGRYRRATACQGEK